MANKKVTDLTAITTAPVNGVMHFIDTTDTSQNAAGSSFKVTKSDLLKENTAAILLNTAKVGITPTQAAAITNNTNKAGYTDALVSAAPSVVLNTAKVGITPSQTSAIIANTSKVGYSEALVNANTSVVANTTKVGYTDVLVASAPSVVLNTAKVGITPTQSAAIVNNTNDILLRQLKSDVQTTISATNTNNPVTGKAVFDNLREGLFPTLTVKDKVIGYYSQATFFANASFSSFLHPKTSDILYIYNGQPNNVVYLDANKNYISDGTVANGKIILLSTNNYSVNSDVPNCVYVGINFVNSQNTYIGIQLATYNKFVEFKFKDVAKFQGNYTLKSAFLYSSGVLTPSSAFSATLVEKISNTLYLYNGIPNNVEFLDVNKAFLSSGTFTNDRITKLNDGNYYIDCNVTNCVYIAVNFVNSANTYNNLVVNFDVSYANNGQFNDFKKLENVIPLTNDKFYNNGILVSSSAFKTIRLNNYNTNIFIDGGLPNNVEYLDSNKAFLSTGTIANGKIIKLSDSNYSVDTNIANCIFVAINFVNSVNSYTNLKLNYNKTFVKVEDFKKLSYLNDAFPKQLSTGVISIIGDSIAAGAITTNVLTQSFTPLVAKLLGMTANLTTAKAGFSYGDVAGSANAQVLASGSANNKGLYFYMNANIIGSEKFFIMQAGTNDHGLSIPTGNVFSVVNGKQVANTNSQTMCGGLNIAIQNIYNTLGHIPILMMTPIQKNFYTQTIVYDFSEGREVNSAGQALSDYAQKIRETADFWGLPLLDLFAVNDMNPYLPDIYNKYFWEGIHPNELGHFRMSQIIYKYILNNMIFPITYEGFVLNASQQPISGATVSIVQGNGNSFGNPTFTTTTNSSGFFRLRDVIGGLSLTATASAAGFTTQSASANSITNISKTFNLI